MHSGKFLALPTLIAALLSIPSSALAQVSINIGAEPVCPYGYYDCPHTTARLRDTSGPSGSAAAGSSEPALGSTAPATSTATLITASIHVTATLVHIPTVETSPLITSTETRCVMDAATQEVKATARNSVKLKANRT